MLVPEGHRLMVPLAGAAATLRVHERHHGIGIGVDAAPAEHSEGGFESVRQPPGGV